MRRDVLQVYLIFGKLNLVYKMMIYSWAENTSIIYLLISLLTDDYMNHQVL
jgi:hypothetical protein